MIYDMEYLIKYDFLGFRSVLVRFGSNMGSRGHGRACKGFLEPVGSNLAEYGPKLTHEDPMYA